MTKKPDRFERIVQKASFLESSEPYKDEAWIPCSIVASLLRREHAWVEQMIVKNPLYGAQNTEWKQGYTQACQDMLDKLKERRT